FLHAYYHHKSHRSTLYEDQGDGYGYEKGDYCVKTFETSGNETRFSVEQIKEGVYLPEYKVYELKIHGLPFLAAHCYVDEVELDFELDHISKITTVIIP